MRVEGAPPVTPSAVNAFERYADIVGHGFVDWHPTQREMLVAHRAPGSSTPQLFRLRSPQGALEPLTTGPERVTTAEWEPQRGRFIVFERDIGGNEAAQLYRLDPDTRATTRLTTDGERHDLAGWLPRQGRVIAGSVPLDRTAAGGRRAQVSTTFTAIDPLAPDAPGGRRLLAELPGPGWFGLVVSPDERQAAVTRYISATHSETWLLDLTHPEGKPTPRRVLPAPGETLRAAHFATGWSADGRQLLLASDRASEFRELMRLDVASGVLIRLTSHIPWDVSRGDGAPELPLLAASVNVDGRDERDPAMREFLNSISPLTNADAVKKPLLITQGKNDPRVPWTESEQIVRKLQARGVPVWYLLAENEGHGFARRENADYQFATLVRFVEETVLK